jgi:DeoR family transcriptional regulator, fructose operon transcriptional repressor
VSADERRQRVIEFLARRGFVELSALVDELGVSESTVRRDLTQLEVEGLIRRTHGGAVFVSDRFSVLSFAARESAARDEKAAIGREAARLVSDGETVLIDGGTTTFQVARHLAGRSVQVVTNSLPIANLLSSDAEVELVFVGGYIYPRTGVALGPLVNEMLSKVHVNKAFMGAAGIMENGLYNANMLMVEAERQMIESSDEVIIVADHTKFGKRALAQLGTWDDVDRVVTDAGLDDGWRATLADKGVTVVLAAAEEAAARVEEKTA